MTNLTPTPPIRSQVSSRCYAPLQEARMHRPGAMREMFDAAKILAMSTYSWRTFARRASQPDSQLAAAAATTAAATPVRPSVLTLRIPTDGSPSRFCPFLPERDRCRFQPLAGFSHRDRARGNYH